MQQFRGPKKRTQKGLNFRIPGRSLSPQERLDHAARKDKNLKVDWQEYQPKKGQSLKERNNHIRGGE